jgi:type II secretory pathway pseudopilin PulG
MTLLGRRRRPTRGNDRGESLIELLVTIVIIGITIPAIMGGVLISVAASSQDRRQVQAQGLLASWSATIARENNTDARYTSCPALSYYATAPFAPASIPAGFTTSVVAITYWNTAAGTFGSTCTVPDSGVRKLELKVAVTAALYPAFDVTQSIVVRKLCIAC